MNYENHLFFKNYRYPLTPKQMRHIFWLCNEISKKYPLDREEVREILKNEFCEKTGIPYFSCSPYEIDSISYNDAEFFITFLYDILNGGGLQWLDYM